MIPSNLLGGLPGAARPHRGAPVSHVFKAGTVEAISLPEGKFRMVASNRKGELKLAKGTDGMQHVTWKDRQTNSVESDLTIFPGDCKLRRIRTPESKDRVYELAFSGRKVYYWGQEGDAAAEAVAVGKFADTLAPPAAGSQLTAASLQSMLDAIGSTTANSAPPVAAAAGPDMPAPVAAPPPAAPAPAAAPTAPADAVASEAMDEDSALLAAALALSEAEDTGAAPAPHRPADDGGSGSGEGSNPSS